MKGGRVKRSAVADGGQEARVTGLVSIYRRSGSVGTAIPLLAARSFSLATDGVVSLIASEVRQPHNRSPTD